MGWEVYPAGLVEVLEYVASRTGTLPLYITENGASFTDTLENGRVHDPLRVSFLEGYMNAAATAIQDTPWSSPGSPAGEEGVEATLETPLSEDEYQALLDMLPGSPGPGA